MSRVVLRHLVLCWSADKILNPIQDVFGQCDGLTILLISDLSTRPWLAAPSRIHCQSSRSVEFL